MNALLEGKNSEGERRVRHHFRSMETIGILLVAAMILMLTLIRYWHNINWSAR